MPAVTAIAIAGLVVAAGSAYMQYQAAQDQADAMEGQANERRAQLATDQKIADIKNVRAQRDLLRQSRIQRSLIANAGVNTGTSGSTGVMGGMGSVSSQTADQQGYFNQMKDNQGDIFASQGREAGYVSDAGQAQASGAQWGAIGALGGSVFGAAGGYTTIFGGNKPTQGSTPLPTG